MCESAESAVLGVVEVVTIGCVVANEHLVDVAAHELQLLVLVLQSVDARLDRIGAASNAAL